ncbi:hypothetical protein GCM10022289_22240 [Pedobacter jeongneungensis]|uniref:Luciferase-like domain-containing protein n=1 Tax=Pedobacter jeongneungensis TaxID=947309 RepID=A0ABP8BDR8_9SPHI
MKIGILEFGAIDGHSGAEILENVLEYAQIADAAGFSRFWLTEHHPLSLAWNSPEMLIPTLACYTDRIKIGIAGTLSAVHSPYRVACDFKLLATLFPGRIDLGFANGKPNLTAAGYLLNRSDVTDEIYKTFNDNVRLTYDFLKGEAQSIAPVHGDLPEMWLLGASYNQLPFAREMGIGFSRSLFHTTDPAGKNADLLFSHMELFEARHKAPPPLNLAFAGICDADSQRAEKRFYDTYKTAYDPLSNFIVGSPAYFSDRLEALYEETGISEFIFKDLDTDNSRRLETLSTLSNLISDRIPILKSHD